MSADGINDYGFTWGQVDVMRATEIKGGKVLLIRAGSIELQVYVSPKSHSVRVWKNHEEMK